MVWGTWVAQLVKLILTQVMISLFLGSSPTLGSVLTVWGLLLGFFPSLFALPGLCTCACIHALSHKTNKQTFVFYLLKLFLMFIYFWKTERTEHRWGRGRERERHTHTHTESKSCSKPWAVSTEPDVGLELMNCEIMTWAEVRCLTDWATQVPLNKQTFKELPWLVCILRKKMHLINC